MIIHNHLQKIVKWIIENVSIISYYNRYFQVIFIEKEHQSWYYLLSTYLLLITIEEKSLRNLFMLMTMIKANLEKMLMRRMPIKHLLSVIQNRQLTSNSSSL